MNIRHESSGGKAIKTKTQIAIAGLVLMAIGVAVPVIGIAINHMDAVAASAPNGNSNQLLGDSKLSPANPTSEPSPSLAPTVDTPSTAQPPAKVVVPPPVLASFNVDTALGFPGAGSRVGPDLFQLSSNGASGVQVAYRWYAVMSDGSSNDTNSCQILAVVTGPQQVDSMRSSSCTEVTTNGFFSSKNVFYLKLSGTYSVTVTDQITGISAKHSFKVVP